EPGIQSRKDCLFSWIPDRRCAASGMTPVVWRTESNQPTLRYAGALFFGRPAAPVSLFSCPLHGRGMERREAPREPCDRLPKTSLAIGRSARRASGTQVFGGKWGSRGARALARSPGASRRSIAARVVGGRTCSIVRRRDRRRRQTSK